MDGNRYFVTDVDAKQKKVTVKNTVTGAQEFFDSNVLLRSVATTTRVAHRDANGHASGDLIGSLSNTRISEIARQRFDFRRKVVESVQAEIAKGKTSAQAQAEVTERLRTEGISLGCH